MKRLGEDKCPCKVSSPRFHRDDVVACYACIAWSHHPMSPLNSQQNKTSGRLVWESYQLLFSWANKKLIEAFVKIIMQEDCSASPSLSLVPG